MTPSTEQTILTSPKPTTRRAKPLLPVRGVTSVLNLDDSQVLAMIDDGRLLWAWDIALEPARSRRKILRVLPACVDDFQAGRDCTLEWEAVLNLMLPGSDEFLLAIDVKNCLNVTGTHVYHLIESNQLAAASEHRCGPGGSARIPVGSFLDFLKRRRYP